MKLYYRVKNAWYDLLSRCQRFKRGYSYNDVWNIDIWFIDTVKPMLIYLRERHSGVPWEFKDNKDDWDAILTEMIECLDKMSEENVRQLYHIQEWWRIDEIIEESKSRFFELFSKYFYDLWD